MTERRAAPRKGEVAFHRLPEPDLLSVTLQIKVKPEHFDSLSQIARNRNRKVSDLCRCALVDFINGHDREVTA